MAKLPSLKNLPADAILCTYGRCRTDNPRCLGCDSCQSRLTADPLTLNWHPTCWVGQGTVLTFATRASAAEYAAHRNLDPAGRIQVGAHGYLLTL